MKLWLAAAAVALVLLPGLASAQLFGGGQEEERELSPINAHPAECARLNRQIDHFMGMYMRAEAAENELWASRLHPHIELLLGIGKADYASRRGVQSVGCGESRAVAEYPSPGQFRGHPCGIHLHLRRRRILSRPGPSPTGGPRAARVPASCQLIHSLPPCSSDDWAARA